MFRTEVYIFVAPDGPGLRQRFLRCNRKNKVAKEETDR